MKEETTSKYRVQVREILCSLGIDGEVLACGLNLKMKVDSPLDRELTIVVKKNNKKRVIKGKASVSTKKNGGTKK